jgi:hypothetical protein
MPIPSLGHQPSGRADGDAVSVHDFDAAQNGFSGKPPLDQVAREQLARDFAAIERAAAALRRGEPSLESWSGDPPKIAVPKHRPVWLMIGLLWLSTALVTAGAVAAIAKLVG